MKKNNKGSCALVNFLLKVSQSLILKKIVIMKHFSVRK